MNDLEKAARNILDRIPPRELRNSSGTVVSVRYADIDALRAALDARGLVMRPTIGSALGLSPTMSAATTYTAATGAEA